MMAYEASGRTVEEAIALALEELGIQKENASVEVLDEPSQGIMGIFGNKSARVKVRMKYEPEQYLEKYLEELLEKMNIDGDVEINEDSEKLEAEIFGEDVGALIGRRGKSLIDLQYLINVIMRRQFTRLNKRVMIDIEKYRARREKTLTQLAKSVANKVIQENEAQEMEPMSPQERRIIHLALQDYPGIKTYSDGEEPYRKVIIAPS
ncbi:MAG: RNA-binding cell elongation regulator Jag/EloR [Candidatus Humimicrobiaceae bacterium]